jgi:hypothetical protein
MALNKFQEKLIADAMSVLEKLTPWEQSFIKSLHAWQSVSPKQQTVLNKINNKVIRLKNPGVDRRHKEEEQLREVPGTGDYE